MEAIIQYFSLFLQNPKLFTNSWMQNSNGIQETLFPIVMIYLIFVVLTSFAKVSGGVIQLYILYIQKKTYRAYLRTLLTLLVWFLFVTGLVYYAFAHFHGYRAGLWEASSFYLTLSMLWVCLSSFFTVFISVIIFGLIFLLVLLKRFLPNSILSIRLENILGINGYIIRLLFWLPYLFLIRNLIIGLCTFYNFSWPLCLIATVTHLSLCYILWLKALLRGFFRPAKA